MKFLLFLCLISFAVHAESFKMSGKLIEFKERDGLLLKGCEKSCEALKRIQEHKKINMLEVRKDMKFTNSIGSDVCDKVYKAQALIGVTESGDQRAFCLFKDQSMVEMNSLSSYLVEKKIATE